MSVKLSKLNAQDSQWLSYDNKITIIVHKGSYGGKIPQGYETSNIAVVSSSLKQKLENILYKPTLEPDSNPDESTNHLQFSIDSNVAGTLDTLPQAVAVVDDSVASNNTIVFYTTGDIDTVKGIINKSKINYDGYEEKEVDGEKTLRWNISRLKVGKYADPEQTAKDIEGKDLVVGNPDITANGATPKDLDDSSIMDFTKFLNSLAAMRSFDSAFKADGMQSLHDYLASNMARFYHQLYYIPNLRNNMAIIVKPETLFIHPPSCNIIYPNMKSTIAFSRDFKSEPTRIIQQSDPVAFTGKSSNMSISCVLFVDEEPIMQNGVQMTRHGLPMYKQVIKPSQDFPSLVTKRSNPVASITSYEKRNGIVGMQSNKGADMFLFLSSKNPKGVNNNTYALNVADYDEATTIGTSMAKLAKYELLRARNTMRIGSCNMYFNPYIVPGFPFLSVESSADSCNIYGYVTAVVHSITPNSWSTTMNYNCAHMDTEHSPIAFPIVEKEYTDKLEETYNDMLGDTVGYVDNEDVKPIINDYYTSKHKISTSYRKIWRPLADFDQYLEEIADDPIMHQEKGFIWYESRSVDESSGESKFFDPQLQAKIKEYSKSIFSDHKPFTELDVR